MKAVRKKRRDILGCIELWHDINFASILFKIPVACSYQREKIHAYLNNSLSMHLSSFYCFLVSAVGMVRLDSPNEERTKGGIFFQIIKLEHPETYRNLNKFRKAYVFKKRLNKSKKSARDPGNLNNKRFDQEAQLK